MLASTACARSPRRWTTSPPLHEIARDAEELARQLLDRSRQVALEQRPHAVAPEQRRARNPVVGERASPDPFLVAARVDLVRLHAYREHRPDEGARVAAAHTVDQDPGGEQLVERADVRERAGAAPGENDSDRAADEPPRRPLDAFGMPLAGLDHVLRPGLERVEPAGERRRTPVVDREQEIAAPKLRQLLDRAGDRAAGDERGAIGLANAEACPAIEVRSDQHDLVELRLVALEQVRVAGDVLAGRRIDPDRSPVGGEPVDECVADRVEAGATGGGHIAIVEAGAEPVCSSARLRWS